MLSVLILTHDEESDLPGCLASIPWCDDIHVIDSGSGDRTVEIAVAHGAAVQENEFQTFAQQRNWAIDNCVLKHDWILFLDADERSTDSFYSAVLSAICSASSSTSGYYCCWKTILGNRWLKRSDNFPKWQFRLFRRGSAVFLDSGHGQKEGDVKGKIGYIREPYLHYAFSRGWDHWMRKHCKYAKQDAMLIFEQRLSLKMLFSRHGSKRNAAIKCLVRLSPGWPRIRFMYSYLLRGGFLEGREAFVYCRMMMWYERQIRSEFYLMRKANR